KKSGAIQRRQVGRFSGAYSFGMIGLGEILHEFKISKDYNSAYKKMSEIAQEAQKTAIESSRMDTSEEYSIVLRKELTSIIVNTLCRDIGLVNGELNYQAHADLAGGLKKLLFKAILRKKDIIIYEKHGEKIIKGLFQVYTDNQFNKNNMLLPPELRSIKDDQRRLVVDHISGMMDSFAAQEYEKFFGKGSAEKLF
ncbi:hypothetical protein, partial [Aeromonas veronii]|uniref:hypothetical protein n=1 Tax=Aeromonas veronii TaxID=654 RepID=UPI0039779EEE